MTERMYADLAPWWPLLSAPEEYVEEAGVYERLVTEAGAPSGGSLLELGSGGGNNASHLKARFECTLVDRSDEMLTVSRALNPECRHERGDMRTVRLGETFDVVFLHDAVAYMTTVDDLRAAIETAFVHCRPGGVALFVPDDVEECFEPSTSHGGHDGDGVGLRYLEWTHRIEPGTSTCISDYVIVVHDADGTHAVVDQHVLGVFAIDTWLELLVGVGFEAEYLPQDLSDGVTAHCFVAQRPSALTPSRDCADRLRRTGGRGA